MSTDWKALCADLVKAVDNYDFDTESMVQDYSVLDRARAALTLPVAEGPTDEELEDLADAMNTGGYPMPAMRRALELWGRPTITPIPVSERLPGPEDCDAEGRCWWAWAVGQVWSFCSPPPYRATHWLPAHALPLPRQPAPDAAAP